MYDVRRLAPRALAVLPRGVATGGERDPYLYRNPGVEKPDRSPVPCILTMPEPEKGYERVRTTVSPRGP